MKHLEKKDIKKLCNITEIKLHDTTNSTAESANRTLALLKIKHALDLCDLLNTSTSAAAHTCFQLNNSTQDKTLSLDLE